jgi:hypothetical protein
MYGDNLYIKYRGTYTSWALMKDRCVNKNYRRSDRYMGRGITVCKRWQGFENFLADMGERPPGLTLDRIDNDKGYFPGNCRWATWTQQQRNKSNNRLLTFRGKTKTASEWAEQYGMTMSRLCRRIGRDGWPLEKALLTPLKI